MGVPLRSVTTAVAQGVDVGLRGGRFDQHALAGQVDEARAADGQRGVRGVRHLASSVMPKLASLAMSG